MALILREGSEPHKKLTDLEEYMEVNGIKIHGYYLHVEVNGTKYYIGRDCDTFPRYIEEPFWRDE